MININHFITALKLTWIRRIVVNNSKWVTLFKSVTNIFKRLGYTRGLFSSEKKVNLFATCIGKILYPAG